MKTMKQGGAETRDEARRPDTDWARPCRPFAKCDWIYIAGPMRGMPAYNYPAFDAAARRLRARKWLPNNPVVIAREVADFYDMTTNPDIMRTVIRRELRSVRDCDAIYLLRGWERSDGARRELQVALEYGLEIFLEAEDDLSDESDPSTGCESCE